MAPAGSGSPSHPEAQSLALLRAGPPPRCHKYDTATRYNGAVCSATPLRADPLGDGLRRPSPLLLGFAPRLQGKVAAGNGGSRAPAFAPASRDPISGLCTLNFLTKKP